MKRNGKQKYRGKMKILFGIILIIIVGKISLAALKHIWQQSLVKENFEYENGIQRNTDSVSEDILAKELPNDRSEALDMLRKQGEQDEDIKQICENEACYPDKILKCLAINAEMKQFVLDYPANIKTVYDGNFVVETSNKQVPLFLQFDERWGYADYGNNIIGIAGCGPTCLSMAYTYLKQDGSKNPIKIADFSVENGYLDNNNDTTWALMTEGAERLGLYSEELPLSKESMIAALDSGNVIICSMLPGDFTRNGHFILIRSYEDGFFYVNDPNSKARSKVGWDFERLRYQIANMWSIGN